MEVINAETAKLATNEVVEAKLIQTSERAIKARVKVNESIKKAIDEGKYHTEIYSGKHPEALVHIGLYLNRLGYKTEFITDKRMYVSWGDQEENTEEKGVFSRLHNKLRGKN